MSSKNGVELLRTNEIADELGQPVSFVQKIIRERKLKAIKTGKSYRVSRQELNRYLGIDNNDEILKKDLLIMELQNKIKNYEIQINAFKMLIESANNIISI